LQISDWGSIKVTFVGHFGPMLSFVETERETTRDLIYTVSQKKPPFYFCNNFDKPSCILIIFGLLNLQQDNTKFISIS